MSGSQRITIVMAKMIKSKYGYEPFEWVQADARLDKWVKNKRLAKKQGVFKSKKLKGKNDETKR